MKSALGSGPGNLSSDLGSAPEPLSHVGGCLSSPPRKWHPLASQECHRLRRPQTEAHRAGVRVAELCVASGAAVGWVACVFPESLSLARRSPDLRAHPSLSPLSPPFPKGRRPRPAPGRRVPLLSPSPWPAVARGADLPKPALVPLARLSFFWSPFRFLLCVCHFLPPAGSGFRSLFPLLVLVPSGAKSGDDQRPLQAPSPPPTVRCPHHVPTRYVGTACFVFVQRFLLSPGVSSGTHHF